MGDQPQNDSAPLLLPSESQLPAGDGLAFPEFKLGDAWGDSITELRATELKDMLSKWDTEPEHHKRRGPFDNERLTGADVLWLAARAWSQDYSVPIASVAVTLRKLGSDMPHNVFYQLSSLHLEGARLGRMTIHFHGGREVQLEGAHLSGAHLSGAHLEGASFATAHLEGVVFHEAHLEGAQFDSAHLEGAELDSAHLEGASLSQAHLEGASLMGVHLDGAKLYRAHLEGCRMSAEDIERLRQVMPGFPDTLPPAALNGAFLDSATGLAEISLGESELGYVSLSDVRWNDVNLAVVDWTRISRGLLGISKRIVAIELGDESAARKAGSSNISPEDKEWALGEYKTAVRANRQLATALRSQGLNEDADRFAYKAQKLQREVLRRQRRYAATFGSWLLDVIAGHGYKPMRTFAVYLLALVGFAVAYYALGQTVGPHLSPLGAFVFSMTSFHGRGFFPGGIVLDDPITVLAAFEAFIGLVIEVSFIATFTQRFFAR